MKRLTFYNTLLHKEMLRKGGLPLVIAHHKLISEHLQYPIN